jgi:microcystin synthetase protein McyA
VGAILSTPRTEPFSLLSEGDLTRLPGAVEDAYPMSALQAGMIFHQEMESDLLLYHASLERKRRAARLVV